MQKIKEDNEHGYMDIYIMDDSFSEIENHYYGHMNILSWKTVLVKKKIIFSFYVVVQHFN